MHSTRNPSGLRSFILTNGGIVGLAQKAFNKVKRYGSEAVGWLKSEIKFILYGE